MNILNLPSWTMLSTDESDHDYRLTIQYDSHEAMCPHCLSMKISRFGKLAQLYMDLPIHAKRVGLNVQRQRYRCEKCGKTFMQELPDIDEKRRVTKRLLRYIQQESLKRTFTSVAEDVGLTEKTIRNIFKQQKPPYQKDWPSDRHGHDFPPVDNPMPTNYGNDISTLIAQLSEEEDE